MSLSMYGTVLGRNVPMCMGIGHCCPVHVLVYVPEGECFVAAYVGDFRPAT